MNLEGRLPAWRSTIDAEARRMARCLDGADLDAPVAACPGWDLRKLAYHTGQIHRWALDAAVAAAPPEPTRHERPGPDAGGDEIGGWLIDGAIALRDGLDGIDPMSPSWHPFPFEQVAWFWWRRQAMETMLHRWDAEHAAGRDATLDPASAADGLHEFFQLGWPRVFVREQVAPPDVSLHVHCTDEERATEAGAWDGLGEWIVWSEGGEYRMETEHRKGDAALRGPAASLLLVLMGRADLDTAEGVDVVGDRAAADAWLGLPGL